MDELEFRRRAITHPSDRDPAFLKAAEASPANRKHLDEMQQLERQVRSTLEVDVPAGLAERILLRQAMAAEEEQVVPLPVTPARTPWRALAIAASVAFLLGMSTRWISWPVAPDTLSLAQVAMSHVYGEEPFIQVLRGILGKWKLTDRVLVNWLSPNTPPPSPCCRRASY
ncbi:hypothetical protein MC65_006335 [Aeromonas caviae]|nr:DUF3379 family protein [Aeromonas caviae]PNO58079.1 hypothetical protein MC65_006335 [Aeromonas caviae]